MQNCSKKVIIPGLILAIGAGILVGFLAMKKIAIPEQKCSGNFPFISREIDCETIDDVAGQVDNLHSNISNIIKEEKDQGHIMRASVFYRDLNSRRWFGINDLEKYYPASLLKLPLAITYYKIKELQPDIFDEKLQIPTAGEDPKNADQHYPPQDPLVPGNTYSIGEMIRHMLLFSDNAPFSVLTDSSKVFAERVFADLGVKVSTTDTGEADWNFSPRIFANVFRMLYNASYVNVKNSNEILDMLSQSTFRQGIVAGVPSGIKVAHKFGEVTAMDTETQIHSRILNDCGVVYKPDNPYILCVMTEGSDFDQLEKVIQRIAQSSYDAL